MKRARVVCQMVIEPPDFGGGVVSMVKLPGKIQNILTGELHQILVVKMSRNSRSLENDMWRGVPFTDTHIVGILPEHPMLHRGCYTEVEADPIHRN